MADDNFTGTKGFYVRQTSMLVAPLVLAGTATIWAITLVEDIQFWSFVLLVIAGMAYGMTALMVALSIGSYKADQRRIKGREYVGAHFKDWEDIRSTSPPVQMVPVDGVVWATCSGRSE